MRVILFFLFLFMTACWKNSVLLSPSTAHSFLALCFVVFRDLI
uniref:Lipoprotein n=1 Tax=Setaria italica TaxID=4555 RepID=K4A3Q6_SETIT